MMPRHPVLRRCLGSALLLVLLSLLLTGVPLFDVIGFEFSFAMAIAASMAAASIGVAVVAHARSERQHSASAPIEAQADASGPRSLAAGARSSGAMVAWWWTQAAARALLLLVPPAAVMALNATRVRQCDWSGGILFYALLPGISVLNASALGVVGGILLGNRRPRFLASAVVLGFVGLSLLVGLWRFYSAPPVFAYDPFAGYFPGSLYDEAIELGAAFFWSRLYQAAIALAALSGCAFLLDPISLAIPSIRTGLLQKLRLAARPKHESGATVATAEAGARRDWCDGHRRAVLATAIAASGLAGALFHYSPVLGFTAAAADIERALGGRLETEHFVILYPRTAELADKMPLVAREHEFALDVICRALGVVPPAKMVSFYFASAQQKQRWMGAGATHMAKPWRREIYLQHLGFPHPTLAHEIAHVVAGEFGDPLFGVSVAWLGWPPANFNAGMIEGLAVAADWRGAELTPHEAARAMLELQLLPAVGVLFGPRFLSFSATRSYAASGSFVRFLLERQGAEPIRTVYRAGGTKAAFRAAYGKDLETLEQEWHAALRALPVEQSTIEIAADRLSRKGIFQRPCARAVAIRDSQAVEYLNEGRVDRAISLLERVCRDDPHDPSHRLMLAMALEHGGRPDEALEGYRQVAANAALLAPVRAKALGEMADLLARRGDLRAAALAVDQALALPVEENTRRLLALRRIAFDPADSSPGQALRDYLLARGLQGKSASPVALMFYAERIDEAVSSWPTADGGLGQYLKGRLLFLDQSYVEAMNALLLAHQQGLGLPFVARENDR
ncbi:MAG: tetratricopeptide repeat protein, partial [Pseudomonadota bacterium]